MVSAPQQTNSEKIEAANDLALAIHSFIDRYTTEHRLSPIQGLLALDIVYDSFREASTPQMLAIIDQMRADFEAAKNQGARHATN